jgi:hypothetical protein
MKLNLNKVSIGSQMKKIVIFLVFSEILASSQVFTMQGAAEATTGQQTCPTGKQIVSVFTKLQSFYDTQIKALTCDEKKRLALICNLMQPVLINKRIRDQINNYCKEKTGKDLPEDQSERNEFIIKHQVELNALIKIRNMPSAEECEKSETGLNEQALLCDAKLKGIVNELVSMFSHTETFLQEEIYSKMAQLIMIESEYESKKIENQEQKNKFKACLEVILPVDLISLVLEYQKESLVFDHKNMIQTELLSQVRCVNHRPRKSIQKSEGPEIYNSNVCPQEYKQYEKPWEGQYEFLYRLKKIQLASLLKSKDFSMKHNNSCFCISAELGIDLRRFENVHNDPFFQWMYDLSKFVEQYNIMPSEEFYDYVMNYPLHEIYGTDPRNKSQVACSADSKYITA